MRYSVRTQLTSQVVVDGDGTRCHAQERHKKEPEPVTLKASHYLTESGAVLPDGGNTLSRVSTVAGQRGNDFDCATRHVHIT